MPGLLPNSAADADLSLFPDFNNNLGSTLVDMGEGFLNGLTFGLYDTAKNAFSGSSNGSTSNGSSEWDAAKYAFDQSVELQQMAQDFNAQQAALDRQWQEKMSSSSYQRAVEDLKKAGLNPALAITNLSGATTGHGSSASVNATSGFKPNTAGELSAVLGFVSEMFKIFQNSNSGKSSFNLGKSKVESNEPSVEAVKKMLDDL